MATVTAFTAARSLEIEQSSVTTGAVDVNGDLILTTRGGTNINAGHVVGPAGTPVNTLEQDVKNTTGFTLNKGTAVYISGSTGSNVLVSKAQANSEATSSKTLGLISENILNDTTGQVTTEGIVSGIDTSTAIAGDSVWLSPTVPGGLTYGMANKPSAPNHLVYLGVVVRSHAVNGEIYVKVQNGYELDELHDVKISAPQKGDVLVHDGVKWINSQPLSQNYIINGLFDIWQRGISFTSSGVFGPDRFKVGSDAGFTASRQNFTANELVVPGFGEGSYYLRMAKNSGGTWMYFSHATEDVKVLAGQTVTMSFYAKAAAATTLKLQPTQMLGSGGTGTPTTIPSQSVSITTSWARYSMTFVIPSLTGLTVNNDNSNLYWQWQVDSSSAVTLDFWGAQLETGTVATRLRRSGATVQEELANCQRYFCSIGWWDYAGTAQTDRAVSGWNKLPVTMRAQPTATPSGSTPFYSINNSGSFGWGTPGIVQTSPTQVLWITGIWPTISPYHAVSVVGGAFWMHVSAEF